MFCGRELHMKLSPGNQRRRQRAHAAGPRGKDILAGGLICAAALLLQVASARAQAAPGYQTASVDACAAAAGEADADGLPPGARIRQGARLVDQLGYFRTIGNRVTFFAADGRRLVALENLLLERIARTIADDPDRLNWSVTGTITEFCGANYLLIGRAVVQGRSQGRQEPFVR